MAIRIDMPKLSDTMTEGTLLRWHKKVGDKVEIGDVIADVETDKATMEMEAFDDGTILQILVNEGEKAPVGSTLAMLGDVLSQAAPATAPTATPAPALATPPPAPAAAAPITPIAPVTPPPLPPNFAPAAQDAPDSSATAPSAEETRVKASPLARKVAAELGVDLATITGSGPGGRIVQEDITTTSAAPAPHNISPPPHAVSALAAAAAKNKAPRPDSAPAASPTPSPISFAPASPSAPSPIQAILPVVKEGDERIDLTTMRKVIATRLLTSKVTIPHFYLHVEVDAAPLALLRSQINSQAEQTHGNKYTLNDFILKAVINATQAVPAVNSSFAGDHIVRFLHVGLAVAVAVEDGLVTPVIKQAETKSLLQISREVKDLATRAKDRKLKPDEFDGGTITVSNLGAWGIESFDAIVNPPQAAILSVGAILDKPVVRNGQVVAGSRMNLGLSCDHRVVDGAIGARFLAEVKRLIEQPALMLI